MTLVDTWAWLALAATDDQHHGAAQSEYRRQSKRRRRLVTTNHILAETVTLLYRRKRADKAQPLYQSPARLGRRGKTATRLCLVGSIPPRVGPATKVPRQARHLLRRFHVDGRDAGSRHHRDFHRRPAFPTSESRFSNRAVRSFGVRLNGLCRGVGSSEGPSRRRRPT